MVIQPESQIVILTGAGISKESGLETFRDRDGIWSTVRIEDVATPEAFARDPDRVHGFYNARRDALANHDVPANAAHLALVELEQNWPGRVLIVTQNIDDLHEKAGSKNLIHMHGELLKVRCNACAGVSPWRDALNLSSACPRCAEVGRLRPDVVWFGEMPMQMERITRALSQCDVFVSIGTSGNVYPAAGFVHEVNTNGRGARTVELNLEASEGASQFGDLRYGPASRIVPAFVVELLAMS